MTFTPDTLVCFVGDTVTINPVGYHNAVEVDDSTWMANGTNSNGGFNIPLGTPSGSFVIDQAKTYYYVCTPHVTLGMKGVIISSSPPMIYGCTDTLACNFDEMATEDDGNCIFAQVYYDCGNICLNDFDGDGVCDELEVFGCTDPTALNYDSTATIDDGSCIAIVYGCTDPAAINYFPGANLDDGSCCYVAGCTDPTAPNYNPLACIDDGSCSISITCSPITNLGVTDIIHNRATFTFDDMNTSTCRVDQLRIKYREVGTTAWSQKNMGSPTGYDPVTGICNSTSRTDKLVLGLSANTTYEWQMRVWYCSTGATAWVNGPNFTTLADCPNVGNLAVTTPTSTKATFTWDDSNGAYSFVRLQARVDTTGSSFFNIGGVGVPYGTYTKDKNGLVPGTSYRAKSRTWCDPNGGAYKAPSWTTFIYFTMPGSVRLDGGVSIDNLDVYPNPSRDIFNVSFTSEDAQDLEVRVINVVGEVVYTENLMNFTGEFTKEIDLRRSTKGIYFLEITTENGVINKKMILQ